MRYAHLPTLKDKEYRQYQEYKTHHVVPAEFVALKYPDSKNCEDEQ